MKERKEYYTNYIDEAITDTYVIFNPLDPSLLEYRYNKYFKDLKIDRSIEFNVNRSAVKISTYQNDKTVIFGSMKSDLGMFSTLALTVLDLETDRDMKHLSALGSMERCREELPTKDRNYLMRSLI